MRRKRRLVLSDAAITDILEQADWYSAQSGEKLARRWQKAVISVLSLIASRPAVGMACSFLSPELHALRRVGISGFPKHLLFYGYDEERSVCRSGRAWCTGLGKIVLLKL